MLHQNKTIPLTKHKNSTDKMALKLILKITKEKTGAFGIEFPEKGHPPYITLLQARNQYIAPNFNLPSQLTVMVDKVSEQYAAKFGKTENYSQVLADCFHHHLIIIYCNGAFQDKCAFKDGVQIPWPTEPTTHIEIELEERIPLKTHG